MRYGITCEPGLSSPRLEYVVNYIDNHPLKPNGSIFYLTPSESQGIETAIYYGTQNRNQKGYYVPATPHALVDVTTQNAFCNTYMHRDRSVRSVELTNKPIQEFINEKSFAFDIFEAIFYHVSRFEEIFAHNEDNHDRGWLEEEKHFLVREGIEKTPVVDELVVAFFEVLLQREIRKTTTYSLSHDVDFIYRFKPTYKFIRSLGATIVHGRGWIQLKKSISHYRSMNSGNKKDPYDSFDFLLRVESGFQKKIIYLMSGGTSKYDNNYAISHVRVHKIIDKALNLGYEIGLHPSYNTPYSDHMLRQEKTKLEKVMCGKVKHSRQHLLRWNWKRSPTLLTKASMMTDSSMGLNKRIGFRCGTGFPYKLYDFDKEEAYSWIETPLVMMESGALHESRRIGKGYIEIMKFFLENLPHNTHICMNFHNNSFDPTVIEYCKLKAFYLTEVVKLGESRTQ